MSRKNPDIWVGQKVDVQLKMPNPKVPGSLIAIGGELVESDEDHILVLADGKDGTTSEMHILREEVIFIKKAACDRKVAVADASVLTSLPNFNGRRQ